MLFQHDSSRSDSSVATSAVIALNLKLCPPSLQPGFGTIRLLFVCSSQETLKEFITHVMMKLKLLQENGFENSLTSSAVTV
jgi:hypothetical protein